MQPTSDKPLTPAAFVKAAGLKDLKQVSEITEQSEQTLINWFNNPKKRAVFECAVMGAAVKMWELAKNDRAYWLDGVKRIQARHGSNQATYKRELLKFARHCVEKYPSGIGAAHCDGPGSPWSVINTAK
jgi:hypothetical protein